MCYSLLQSNVLSNMFNEFLKTDKKANISLMSYLLQPLKITLFNKPFIISSDCKFILSNKIQTIKIYQLLISLKNKKKKPVAMLLKTGEISNDFSFLHKFITEILDENRAVAANKHQHLTFQSLLF